MTDPASQKSLTPLLPPNETKRLAALHRYRILDTPPEAAFDRITRLAARLFEMPIALISLVDESRAWFKSCVGFGASEVPRDATLCSFAVLTDEPLIIPDTRLDDRFACNPFVQAEPGVQFYAGAPLLSHDGFNLGTLCLLDSQPRQALTAQQQATLVDLAAMVVDELELRLAVHQIAQSEEKYRTLFESIDQGFCICEMLFDQNGKPADYRFVEVNPEFERLTGLEQVTGKRMRELDPNHEAYWFDIYGRVVQTREAARFENYASALDRWFDINAFCIGAPQDHLFAVLFTNITERKKVEQERDRFLAVGSDLQVITGNDGYFRWVSPTFERLLGWTATEMTSRPWTEFVHPDDIPTSELETASLFSGSETFAFENRYRHKDGSYRWLLWRAQPHLEAQVLYAAAIDITDRKQAELEIQKFVSLADNSGEFIGMCDLNFVPFYVNPAGQQLVGLDDVQQYIETSVKDFFFPEDQNFILNEFLPRVLQEGRAEVEIRFSHFKTGAALWMIYNVFYIKGENNQSIGLATVSRNITDRKQVEAALRESENRLRLALESAQLGTWDFNPSTGLLQWDEHCKAMFGLSPEAEINYDVFLAGLHPEDRDLTHQVVQRALTPESGGEYDIEYRTIGIEDGIERWIAAKGKAFFNRAGIASRFIGTVLNITTMKQAEAERAQLLQREQAARETAERANRIKDEFLAVLSHELRSPLNPILGWTRLLQNGKLDAARQREALATIERNAKLQTQLIEDLLDISRIMQGKLSLTVTSVSLTFVIMAAVETVRLAAEAKNIQILLDLTSATPPVSGDAARLQQVVWNLLTNAVKFTPNGGQVTVELRQLDQLAQIRVTDTGKGIDPQFLPYVFEYFRQADATTTRKFGGLGLGLAIVRQIVEMHGGTVWAESQGEGQGATFIVQFPLNLQARASEAGPPRASVMTETPLSHLQILLVEDETDTREFQAFLLEQSGARVTAVTSGVEALQALDRFLPDMLVSDVGMAEMDGYMLMQHIRARPPNKGGLIPAIALTAYARDFDRQQALQTGFQRHLTKPIEPQTLIEAITALYFAHVRQ